MIGDEICAYPKELKFSKWVTEESVSAGFIDEIEIEEPYEKVYFGKEGIGIAIEAALESDFEARNAIEKFVREKGGLKKSEIYCRKEFGQKIASTLSGVMTPRME